MALVPHGHRRFAKAVHDDVAIIVDGGHAFVAAVVLGPARHVFLAAVREGRRHHELLFGPGTQRRFLGKNIDPGHARVRILWSGHALSNPAGNHLILG